MGFVNIFVFQNDVTEARSLMRYGQGGCVYVGVADSEESLGRHLANKWSLLTEKDGKSGDFSIWGCLGSREVPSHLSSKIMADFREKAMARPSIALDLLSTLKEASYSAGTHIDFGDGLEDDIHRLCCLSPDNMRQIVCDAFSPSAGRLLPGQQLVQLMLMVTLESVIYEHVGDDDPALT